MITRMEITPTTVINSLFDELPDSNLNVSSIVFPCVSSIYIDALINRIALFQFVYICQNLGYSLIKTTRYFVAYINQGV